MSEYGGNETVTCPSWALLVESEEEPAASLRGHVARCPRCRERYRIVTALRLMGTREGRTPPESGCPELAEWLELATGDPEARTRALLVEHLSGCDPCSRRWSYISDSLASTDPDWELKEPDPTIPYVEAPGRTLRWGPFLGRAAAVILAVGLVWAMASGLLPRIGTGSATRWRGPDPALAASVQWGAAEPAVTFTWETRQDATAYRIRVWNRRGDLLLDRSLGPDTSRFEFLPEEARRGQSLLWQVEALRGGEVVARTAPRTLIWEAG